MIHWLRPRARGWCRFIRRQQAAALILLATVITPAAADDPDADIPVISIIIDDIGHRKEAGLEALALPGPVTYSFLPFAPYAKALAEEAHSLNKEVMLHLPMESRNGNHLGPGALATGMTEEQILETLKADLQAVPHAVGLNNHMGSLLTSQSEAMGWLMQGISATGDLFFIDSRTSELSVAERIAREHAIPTAHRNVFLDHDRDPEKIREQFQRLIHHAHQHGKAIGIGHPYPETIAVLQQELAQLPEHGVLLISTSQNVELERRNIPWQASLSPSPQAAKNSKP